MISRAPGNAVSTAGLTTEEERDPGLSWIDKPCVRRAICDVELYPHKTEEQGIGPETHAQIKAPRCGTTDGGLVP